MKNEFVKEYTTSNGVKLSINYVRVNEMMKSLHRVIATESDYVAWVRDWKKQHAGLVDAIQSFRKEKDDVKYSMLENEYRSLEHAHTASELNELKLKLRPFARSLYEMRAENKARLKAGEFVNDYAVDISRVVA